MFKRFTTDQLNWIIIIGVILFIIEIVFFGGGIIFPAIFSGIMAYVGWKSFHRLWGKILFWIGFISLAFSILNMMAVRFFVAAGIVMFIIHYYKSKKEPDFIQPKAETSFSDEPLEEIQVEPIFTQRVFGDQETVNHAFAWRDINVHGFFGDRTIDLSNTVLPEDTTVISIRHVVGNIEIHVPYEVEVCVHHSSIFGRAVILGEYNGKLINQTLSYKTPGYDTAKQRVKIMTSLVTGDIEVKRV